MNTSQTCSPSQLEEMDKDEPSAVRPLLSSSDSGTPDSVAETIRKYDWEPWRYRGYRSFAKFTASDDDFFVVKRFGSETARVILFLQDQVTLLAEDLELQDRQCMEASPELADAGSFRSDQWERTGILNNLAAKLDQYHRLVLNHSKLKSRPKASAHQVENVRQWLQNACEPIERREVAYLEKTEDLIPVVTHERTPLQKIVDTFHLARLVPFLRDRQLNEYHFEPHEFERDTTIYYKDYLIDGSIDCAATVIGLGMLVGPMWWLQYLSTHGAELDSYLGAVTACVVLFAALLNVVSNARVLEVLVASAAYTAALLIFVQLVAGSSSGINHKE